MTTLTAPTYTVLLSQYDAACQDVRDAAKRLGKTARETDVYLRAHERLVATMAALKAYNDAIKV